MQIEEQEKEGKITSSILFALMRRFPSYIFLECRDMNSKCSDSFVFDNNVDCTFSKGWSQTAIAKSTGVFCVVGFIIRVRKGATVVDPFVELLVDGAGDWTGTTKSITCGIEMKRFYYITVCKFMMFCMMRHPSTSLLQIVDHCSCSLLMFVLMVSFFPLSCTLLRYCLKFRLPRDFGLYLYGIC